MKIRDLRVCPAAALAFLVSACAVAKTPPTVEQKARDLHGRMLTVDTHSDTAMGLMRADWKFGDRHDPAARGAGKIDLPRMKEGGFDAEFFAAFVGQGPLTPEAYIKARDRAMQAVAAVRKMTEEYPSMIGLAVDPEGARRLKKEGRLTAFIGLENGYPIGRDLALVSFFHEKGVRYITLCPSSDHIVRLNSPGSIHHTAGKHRDGGQAMARPGRNPFHASQGPRAGRRRETPHARP